MVSFSIYVYTFCELDYTQHLRLSGDTGNKEHKCPWCPDGGIMVPVSFHGC